MIYDTDFMMPCDKNESVRCIDQSLGSSCLLFVVVVMPVAERYRRGENMGLLFFTI
jgi:hypothetical protein